MADNSLNEFHVPVNEEIRSRSYDGVNEYLSKAMALSQLMIHEDFLNYSEALIRDYLWALSEMMEKAYEHWLSLLDCPNVTHSALDIKSASTIETAE